MSILKAPVAHNAEPCNACGGPRVCFDQDDVAWYEPGYLKVEEECSSEDQVFAVPEGADKRERWLVEDAASRATRDRCACGSVREVLERHLADGTGQYVVRCWRKRKTQRRHVKTDGCPACKAGGTHHAAPHP